MANFTDKIKDFFAKIKEENKGFGATMMRINAPGFYGNVNRNVKNGVFWEGSYISIEDSYGVIYGSNQSDYVFTGDDIASFDFVDVKCSVSKGNESLPAVRYLISFKDGKTAQADILLKSVESFKAKLGL